MPVISWHAYFLVYNATVLQWRVRRKISSRANAVVFRLRWHELCLGEVNMSGHGCVCCHDAATVEEKQNPLI